MKERGFCFTILFMIALGSLVIFSLWLFTPEKEYPVFHKKGRMYLIEDSFRIQFPDSSFAHPTDSSKYIIWNNGYRFVFEHGILIEKPKL